MGWWKLADSRSKPAEGRVKAVDGILTSRTGGRGVLLADTGAVPALFGAGVFGAGGAAGFTGSAGT